MGSNWLRGTGRSIPNRFARNAIRSTRPHCGPIFALERVLHDGVFFAAGQVYGITFELRPDLAGYHPDVRVWEVRNADGSSIGLYLGDYYAREGKRGGAWMNSFVEQSSLLGQLPVVVNNLNVTKPAARQSGAVDPGRGRGRCSTNSVMPCTGSSRM